MNIIIDCKDHQSSSWQSKAVPLRVQKSAGCDLVLRSTGRMKLVL